MLSTTKQRIKSPIVKLAEEIASNTNRPMSPDQIKAKYQLEFPFTVRRVVTGDALAGTTQYPELLKVGALLTFTGFSHDGDYVVYDRLQIIKDSERFVLV